MLNEFKNINDFNKSHNVEQDKKSQNLTTNIKEKYNINTIQAKLSSEILTYTDVMQLQNTIGNKATMQLLKNYMNINSKVVTSKANEVVQKKSNNTGLPDNLKAGVENLSGISMDDVRVHYDSNKPSQVGALAYTQGTDIHIGSGQEKHLPHEAWHVVQQAQGRVRPTIQFKDINVNDDVGLEHEADAMGNKASQIYDNEIKTTKNIFPINKNTQTENLSTIQMKYDLKFGSILNDLTTSKDYKKILEAYQDGFCEKLDNLGEALEYFYNKVDLIKIGFQDKDVKIVKEYEASFDKLLELFDKEELGVIYPIFKDIKIELLEKTNLLTDMRSSIYEKLNEILNKIDELDKQFPDNDGGGFSAKGRAHEMDVTEMPVGGFFEDKAWLENISLNGTLVNKKVYKQSKKIQEEASDPIYPAGKEKNLKTAEELINNNLNTDQKREYTKPPTKIDRNGGQVKNMGGINATQYAILADIKDYEKTQWEWLHIMAASLGGVTNGTNLVVGTKDTNTQMMPFESNISNLAKFVGDTDDYENLNVEFYTTTPDKNAKHKVDNINIKWTLTEKRDKSKKRESNVKFNPLETNSNISKREIDILEHVLKEERNSIMGKNSPKKEGDSVIGKNAPKKRKRKNYCEGGTKKKKKKALEKDDMDVA